jgi:hypothetical protein
MNAARSNCLALILSFIGFLSLLAAFENDASEHLREQHHALLPGVVWHLLAEGRLVQWQKRMIALMRRFLDAWLLWTHAWQ